jgi:hypothetical protein
MIEILPYEPEHIDEIMKHPREWEMKLSFHADWNAWKKFWKIEGPAYTLLVDGKPVVCAGVMIMEDRIGEAWSVISSIMPKYRKTCFARMKRMMDRVISLYHLKGIQAFVDPTFDGAKHLMIHLGFREDKLEKVCGMDMIRFWRAC